MTEQDKYAFTSPEAEPPYWEDRIKTISDEINRLTKYLEYLEHMRAKSLGQTAVQESLDRRDTNKASNNYGERGDLW